MNLSLLSRWVSGNEFVRFIIVGASNTAITFILYLWIANFVDYRIAYTITYALGVVVAYFLSSMFVFKVPVSLSRFFKYPIVYIIQYVYGVMAIWFISETLMVRHEYAMAFVVITSIPLTFVVTRYILKTSLFK